MYTVHLNYKSWRQPGIGLESKLIPASSLICLRTEPDADETGHTTVSVCRTVEVPPELKNLTLQQVLIHHVNNATDIIHMYNVSSIILP